MLAASRGGGKARRRRSRSPGRSACGCASSTRCVPVEAQWALWNARPDPEFLADPRRGSPHSRGVAVDLTLLDGGGRELDMGTAFDAFTPLSHHGRTDVSAEAQRNRLLLMGLMTAAGWDFYRNEWWHYQLFDARRYPLICDADLPRPMM